MPWTRNVPTCNFEGCTNPVKILFKRDGRVGQYTKRCPEHHGYTTRDAELNPAWKGGRRVNKQGYVMVAVGKKRQRGEHRVIWETANGPIPRGFHIHHINHVRSDNRIENLTLISHSDHSHHHGLAPKKPAGRWARDHDQCMSCGGTELEHWAKGLCCRCYLRTYQREHPRRR